MEEMERHLITTKSIINHVFNFLLRKQNDRKHPATSFSRKITYFVHKFGNRNMNHILFALIFRSQQMSELEAEYDERQHLLPALQ
jgi:hypothetical protein